MFKYLFAYLSIGNFFLKITPTRSFCTVVRIAVNFTKGTNNKYVALRKVFEPRSL